MFINMCGTPRSIMSPGICIKVTKNYCMDHWGKGADCCIQKIKGLPEYISASITLGDTLTILKLGLEKGWSGLKWFSRFRQSIWGWFMSEYQPRATPSYLLKRHVAQNTHCSSWGRHVVRKLYIARIDQIDFAQIKFMVWTIALRVQWH